MITHNRLVVIQNKRGLHARAAAKFSQVAGRFKAQITVTRGSQAVSGTSIMGLMMLAASPGTEIVLAATGEQGEEALNAICDLVEAKFEEE
tara:strand:- start:422 stop:694 length:273 start_codon:yes stop_codon:yes gene_type:complete